nr:hypothetical protein [Tanacetum cinerariifolium]
FDDEYDFLTNTIPYKKLGLVSDAKNVSTEASAATSDQIAMIVILNNLTSQVVRHAKTNQEITLENKTLKNKLVRCKQEIGCLDTQKIKLDLENQVRNEQGLVIQRNQRNAKLLKEKELLKSTLSAKDKSIEFLKSEKEKVLTNIGEEERHNEEEEEEEEEDELYQDVNINQGRGLQASLEIKDSHVTLTLVKPDGQQESLFVSSQFVTSMLNPTLDAGMESIFETASTSVAPLLIPTLPLTHSAIATITTTSQAPTLPTPILSEVLQNPLTFASVFRFNDRRKSLEENFSEVMQTNQFAGAVSTILGLVKDQVKAQVSKILPRIKQVVNEQLEAEVLTRSSISSRTSYAVAADLSEMELKKILIEKMEGNKSIQRSDEQRNLYKALIDAYEFDKIILKTYGESVTLKRRRDDDEDKDEEPSVGPDRGSKRRREGKEPESTSTPSETATKSVGRSITGSRFRQASVSESAFAEEPVQTTSQMEEPSHPEFETGADDQPIVQSSQHPELFSQLQKPPTLNRDWNKTLPAPLPLIPDTRGRRVIPFAHFINNDLEYLRGGASSHKYTTSVTKTKAADYGHIKWNKDLVSSTMWIQEPIDYDKHALWGVSHWGRKRQQFYGFIVNRESARDVYSKRKIVAVTELKIVEWHSYKHLDWIMVRRNDDKLYKFKEGDLKRLRLQDIEDMLLLLVQGKLSNLTVEERFTFNVSLRMFTRSIRREAYTAYSNLRGFIYQNKDKKNRLMRIDELHKFSDGTLNDVRTALDDRLKGIRMRYLPQTIWRKRAWKGSLEECYTKKTSGYYKGPYDLSYAAPILQESKFFNTSAAASTLSSSINLEPAAVILNQQQCGDPLDGAFCRRYTCESCGNGAHIGYNYPPKVSVVFNPEPCHNQNVDELPQTLTNFHSTRYSGDENTFAHDSTPNFVNDSPNDFHPPPQTSANYYEFCGNNAHYSHDCPPQVLVFEIKNAFGNNQYKLEDVQELFRKLFNDVQNIHEELAEYINIPSWNYPTFSSHDDEDYTIAITSEEPDNSLSMWDKHLDNILATKPDEVIKSSVEDLVLIPSESEGILDNTCDVPFRDNSPPLDVSKDQFEEFFNSNDDSTSIDENYFSIDNIDYVEASPPDYKLVSLEEYDLFLFEMEPDQGKLTSVVMKDNLAEPRVHVPNVLTTHPTLMLDSNFIPSDNSLPESKIFYFDIEEKNSGSTTIHADISLSVLECFNFNSKPDPGELTSIVDFGIRKNVLFATNVNLPPEEDHSPVFAYVVWIFLSFLTYLVVPSNLLSFGNEDTIFDPGIFN